MSDIISNSCLIEGIVEQNPITGVCYIRVNDGESTPFDFDPQEALKNMVGKDVRFVLVPLLQLSELVDVYGGSK